MRPSCFPYVSVASALLASVPSVSYALTGALPPGTTSITIVASADEGHCVINVGTAKLAGPPGPAQYAAFAERAPLSPACHGPLGYEILGQAYTVPHVAIAKGAENEIAVVFDGRGGISPSSPVFVTVLRLNPTTLATVASSGLAIPPNVPGNPPEPSVWVSSAEFTVPGDLLVFGTKDGMFPAVIEVTAAGGPNYQAKFPKFASAVGAQGVTQVLSW